ncbi:MAG: hypothetical protein WCB12_10050 [Bryobacteraceae bacterium]
MTRGRPFEPGNRFGRGRPKGSPNKKTQQAQKLFEENSPAIMALAINRSREDPHMLRMLASHVVPQRRGLPVNLGRLPMDTLEDLDRASAATLKKATSGKIGLSEATDFCSMIEIRRRVLETQNLERRLSALENPGALPNPGSPGG